MRHCAVAPGDRLVIQHSGGDKPGNANEGLLEEGLLEDSRSRRYCAIVEHGAVEVKGTGILDSTETRQAQADEVFEILF